MPEYFEILKKGLNSVPGFEFPLNTSTANCTNHIKIIKIPGKFILIILRLKLIKMDREIIEEP